MWVGFWVWCAVEVEGGRGGETELSGLVSLSLSLSLVGAGPGAVRWGGEGRQEEEDERMVWFEKFRNKKSSGLEGSPIKNGAEALGSGGMEVEVDLFQLALLCSPHERAA